MREVRPITIKKDSELWKQLQKEAEHTAEQVAAAAADRAKKEFLEKATQKAAAEKAYRDSIKHYDGLYFANKGLQDAILASKARRAELDVQSHEEWKRQEHYRKQLEEKCSHEMVIEHRTTYCDDYDHYHDGDYERKCIECFLAETSTYHPTDRNYGFGSNAKVYTKLLKSQVVLLRKTIDGKEYELEFDDLKW